MYIFEGEIRTISPLHIASGDGNIRYDFATGRRLYGGKGGAGHPLACTQAIEVALPNEEGHTARIPIIHANTLRGRIRRQAASIVADALAEKGEKIEFDTLLRMLSGTSSGRPNKTPIPVDMMQEIIAHPFAGLFGGGERMLPSRLVVHAAIGAFEEAAEIGMIQHATMQIAPHQAFAVIPIRRIHDLMHDPVRIQNDYERVVREFLDRATEILQEEAERQRARKNGGESASRMIESMNALEFVIPGVRFHWRVETSGDSHHAGLLLMSLEKLAHAQV
ncbi:MAG: type IV CRISPR-associated protein Csf2, partial [Zetaproteobacteria bacterium]